VQDIKTIIPDFNNLYLEDFNNLSHPSSFVSEDNYQIFIIREIDLESSGLVLKSRGYIIHQNEVYRYHRNTKSFERFEKSFFSLHQELDPIYKKNYSIISNFILEIDKLEDSIYERKPAKIFMDVWFELKKDLSIAERFYKRNLLVIERFVDDKAELANFAYSEFVDLKQFITQSSNLLGGQLLRLDSLHHYYTSIKSDHLNHNLYLLTMISAIFLPLNLIVGFFGINTPGLYFSEHSAGTDKVLVVLVISLIISTVSFPLIKWLDLHFTKIFLGKEEFSSKKRKSRKIVKNS
jgi:magnesium transporter